MKAVQDRFYEFETFRVDSAKRRLWQNGEVVHLTSKAFDILLALVEKPGQTVGKQELLDRVWSDSYVEEGNLNRNISTLRKVLGDDGRKQQFIRTVPKLGYRFTAQVRQVERTPRFDPETNEAGLEADEPQIDSRRNASIRDIRPVTIAVAAIVLFILISAAVLASLRDNQVNSLASPEEIRSSRALELYQKGRSLWQTRSGQDLHEATLLLESAVNEDPEFALAHAALADAYAFDIRYWRKAEAAAREAIRLDPAIGEPHASIGFVRLFWEWDLENAEREFVRAIQLSPGYATAHQWYALSLFASGSGGNAAYVEMKRALELEPNSVSINADMCLALYYLRRYDEAIAQCNVALGMDPNFYSAHMYLYEIYNASGHFEEAVNTYFRLEALSTKPSSSDARKTLRNAYESGGVRRFWEARIDHFGIELSRRYQAARHYARLGKKEESIKNLQTSYESHDFEFTLFAADPVFDVLRDDPRFDELVKLLQSQAERDRNAAMSR